MIRIKPIRTLAIAAALIPGTLIAASAPSSAQVALSISVGIAPPALPVYVQPPCPAPGYLWTPGYWGYNSGYYWVPGAWAQPPAVGLLWTPPYWGFAGGFYGFHTGYWGPTVGFYGGINYGFGYGGAGFGGGYWSGGNFLYNRAYSNVNVNSFHNTYVNNTTINNYNNSSHVSYNGGPNGIAAQPTATERQAASEQHTAPTATQQQGFAAARADRGQYAAENGGHPASLATNRSGFGYANEVNTRQGNQQSRIESGVRGGGITPGEENNLENRDNSIHSEAQSERDANGGYLTNAEKQQINARQNNVSNSIYNDRHNANTDAAAAARNGETANQERGTAQQLHQQERPRGPESYDRGGTANGGFAHEAPGSGGYRSGAAANSGFAHQAPGSGGYRSGAANGGFAHQAPGSGGYRSGAAKSGAAHGAPGGGGYRNANHKSAGNSNGTHRN